MSAIAAELAVFPTTNAQPAKNPAHGPRTSRPYTYVPPDVGYCAASWAEDVALQKATRPARHSPSSRPAPAAPAAGAHTAKTPAPIIEPSPITTASPSPSRRASPSSAPVLTKGIIPAQRDEGQARKLGMHPRTPDGLRWQPGRRWRQPRR